MEDKRAIRKRALAARDALTREEIVARSSAICSSVTALPEVRACSTLMAFLSTGSEVITDEIICWAWQQSKRVLAPVCLRAEGRLIVSPITCFADVEPGYRGIREPRTELLAPVEKDEIDVVVVPAVAFDRRGYRVGYGGGYYDRFLAGMGPRAIKIGIAFSCQLIPEAPEENHDIAVDVIVTDEEIIETAKCRIQSG